jgi:hypothetical protein
MGRGAAGLGVCEDDSDVILAESGHSGHKWRAERPKQFIAPLASIAPLRHSVECKAVISIFGTRFFG